MWPKPNEGAYMKDGKYRVHWICRTFFFGICIISSCDEVHWVYVMTNLKSPLRFFFCVSGPHGWNLFWQVLFLLAIGLSGPHVLALCLMLYGQTKYIIICVSMELFLFRCNVFQLIFQMSNCHEIGDN